VLGLATIAGVCAADHADRDVPARTVLSENAQAFVESASADLAAADRDVLERDRRETDPHRVEKLLFIGFFPGVNQVLTRDWDHSETHQHGARAHPAERHEEIGPMDSERALPRPRSRRRGRSLVCGVAVPAALVASSLAGAPALAADGPTPGITGDMPLVITELAVKTSNGTSTDPDGAPQYVNIGEFIEVHNVSGEPQRLGDFSLTYRTSKDNDWTPDEASTAPDTRIPAGGTVVLWSNYANASREGLTPRLVTDRDFNAYWQEKSGTDPALVDGQTLLHVSKGDGMANSSARSLTLTDISTGATNTVAYESGGTTNDRTLVYTYDAQGAWTLTDGSTATPGTLLDGQVPQGWGDDGDEGDPTPPELTDISEVPAVIPVGQDLTLRVRAAAPEGATVERVTLLLADASGADLRDSGITGTESGGEWTFTVPGSRLSTPGTLDYAFGATTSQGGNATTDRRSVALVAATPTETVPAATPLVVSEVMPDTVNVGGADGYEFIEVANTSSREVDFGNDYTIRYHYPASGDSSDVVWAPVQQDLRIPAGGTLVLWIRNGANDGLTADDFNAAFGLTGEDALVLGQGLAEIDSAGMSNSAARGLKITTRTNRLLNIASYPDKVSSLTGSSHSVKFAYDASSDTSTIASTDQAPTPGVLTGSPVHALPHVFPTPSAPTVVDHTPATFSSDADLAFRLTATSAGGSLHRVTLWTRIDGQDSFTPHDLLATAGSDDFTLTIPRIDLLRRATVEYYTEVSDGVNPVVRSESRILRNPSLDTSPVRLNVADGTNASGTTPLRATTDDPDAPASLSIDGAPVPGSDVTTTLESAPLIAAEVTQTDIFFFNSFTRTMVITGTPQQEDWTHNVLGVFDGGTYANTETVSARVPLDMLTPRDGGATVTLYLNSGTKSSATDIVDEAGTVNTENADNYLASNLRLVLPDGTALAPTRATAAVSPGTEGAVTLTDVTEKVADRSAQLKIGDSAGQYEYLRLEFDVDQRALTARQYLWDTTAVEDGRHVVSASAGTNSADAEVLVDNTAPTITPSIADGSAQRGDIILDAEVTDEVSGVPAAGEEGSPTATLTSGEGEAAETEQITLPYGTSSATLPAGTHTLSVTATDRAGNTATRIVTFTTPEEAPSVSDVSGTDGVDPTLSVTASDASGGPLDVTFLRGDSFTPSDTDNVASTSGETARTGPVEDQEESALDAADLEAASAADGSAATTTAPGGGFPYQRFAVRVPDHIASDQGASTTVRWSGSATPDTDVLALVRRVSDGAWETFARAHTDAEGAAAIVATVPVAGHVQDGSLEVVIQDEGGWAGAAATPASAMSPASAMGPAGAFGPLAASGALADPFTSSDEPISQEDADPSTYDFTLAWESDTQYYNADYAGDGVTYEHQLKIHQWLLDNQERMDIRYLFHTGDIVDNAEEPAQWERADASYAALDEAGFPYGVLAGNHDVNHKTEDYTNYSAFFGESRYSRNPWYGASYQDNRGHYDLISAGGIDFLMVYTGWGVGDEEIAWLNGVLDQYPDRVAILNFHEYLLASGGLGLQPQEVYDRVVTKHPNVKMILSGHYHSAKRTVSSIDDDGDGTPDRQVVNLLFDYQALEQGGMGFLRLMHVNTADGTIRIRTYSPSLEQYGSQGVASSSFTPADEEFTIDLKALGVPTRDQQQRVKSLSTDAVSFDLLSTSVIGAVTDVPSGTVASVVWRDAPEGRQGWYAVIENGFGGRTVTPVTYVDAAEDPGTDPGTNPGAGPGTGPGAGPGTGPGAGPGTGPGADPTNAPGTDPRAAGTGPGPRSGSGPSGGLAATGADSAGLLGVLSVLVAAGAVMIAASARRRRG